MPEETKPMLASGDASAPEPNGTWRRCAGEGLRARLGEEAFVAARTKGREMPLGQAIEYA